MMKKTFMILFFACYFLQINAQQSINDYKYVIVEKQFHFQNEENQYNLNELTRFLLKKNGFKPILESDIYPKDLKSNYCLALKSEIKASGFLNTKVVITLKDCNNNVLFETYGTTKEKDIEKAYSYGIRKAFEGFKGIDYNYIPKDDVVNSDDAEVIAKNEKDTKEVEELKAEIEVLKNEKAAKTVIGVEALGTVGSSTKIKKSKKKAIYLEAIAVDNGFNLVNSESKKVIHILIKTGMDNVFTVSGGNGIVYKKDGEWMREYTKGKKTFIETLNVVFQ